MNQPYARVNQPYAALTLASALREMFGVQLYKNNARALLSRILSILNLDWLQHARSVRGVYEFSLLHISTCQPFQQSYSPLLNICDSTPANEGDVGRIHFELCKQMCCKVKICQILYNGLRWPLVHIPFLLGLRIMKIWMEMLFCMDCFMFAKLTF